MYFTLSQAAKEVGKSKGTLSKMVKSGALSVAKKTDKSYQIEAAELFRVFPKKETATPQNEQMATSKNGESNASLHKDIERLNDKITMLEKTVENLESDKAFLQGELSKTTTLISDMREKSPEKPVEAHKKIFGIFPRKKG